MKEFHILSAEHNVHIVPFSRPNVRLIFIKNKVNVKVKVKVKVALVQALRLCTGRTAHRGSRGIALPFHDHGTRRGEGSASRSDRSLPPGKTRYPLYRRLGGPQGRSGQVRKISPQTGFYPRVRARSQSLYWLRYPAHKKWRYRDIYFNCNWVDTRWH